MIDMVSIVNYAIVMSEEDGMEHVIQWVSVIARMVSKGKNVVSVKMAFTFMDEIVSHVNVISSAVRV